MAGRRSIAPELAFAVVREPNPLTERERAVLRLAAEGLTAKEIGAQLFLSNGTVRNYLSEALAKLGVGSRIEAVKLAEEKGWLAE
jgi:DNA-binding NarL/FixJ family response regulator